MAEGATLLVDHVLPAVGYRHWVLSFEGRLAVRLGYDEALLARVAEGLARAAMQDMRWSVKERHGLGSVGRLHAGVFTVVQRFRSDPGLYVQAHGHRCLLALRRGGPGGRRPQAGRGGYCGHADWPVGAGRALGGRPLGAASFFFLDNLQLSWLAREHAKSTCSSQPLSNDDCSSSVRLPARLQRDHS